MKGYKKASALFSVALALGLLAGCAGPQSTTSAASTTSEAPVTSTSVEPSTSSAHTHDPQFVEFVPSTTEVAGVSDHFKCEGCGKLFDSLGNEVTLADLTLPLLASNSIYDEVLEHAALEGISLYAGDDIVSKALVDNMYLIGVDAEGVIIYGGRFGGAGYGGPGDGFYHDGSFAPVAGQVCGIFDIDEHWAPWPATYEDAPAWTLFELAIPEDGFIVAGPQEEMADLVCALLPEVTEEAFLAEENNAIFEGLGKGRFNEDVLALLDGEAYGQISLQRTVVAGLFVDVTSGGSTETTELVLGADGLYAMEFSLALWGNVSIYGVDNLGVRSPLWFDNTTISGAVTSESTFGADWTKRLYHESAEADIGKFFCGYSAGADYKFVYNPTDESLVFYTPDMLVITGNASGLYFLEGDPASGSATVTLETWQGIKINYLNEDFELVALNHENAEFTGAVLNSTDCDWTEKLYRDPDDTSKYLTCTGGSYTLNVTLGAAPAVEVVYND